MGAIIFLRKYVAADTDFGCVVANPDITPFSSSVPMGGDPPGIMDCGFQALNERIGEITGQSVLTNGIVNRSMQRG